MSHSSIALTSMIYTVVTILVVSHPQIMQLEKVYSADPSVGRSIGHHIGLLARPKTSGCRLPHQVAQFVWTIEEFAAPI